MEKNLQLELYIQVKDLIRAKVGKNFSIQKQANGKTVFMIIQNGDTVHLAKVGEFLDSLKIEEYPREKIKKNHGGIDGTILISISMIKETSISLIREMHATIAKTKPRATEESTVPVDVSSGKDETPSLETKKPRLNKYEFAKYITSILKFEGLNHENIRIKKDKNIIVVCSEDVQMVKIVEDATNYYFGKKMANVSVGNSDPCIYFDIEKDQSMQSKKYSFCCPPNYNSDEKDVFRRLQKVFFSKKYQVQKIWGGFKVVSNLKNIVDLQLVLLEMGWNTNENDGGFTIKVSEKNILMCPEIKAKPRIESKEELKAETNIETLVNPPVAKGNFPFASKADAFDKLCELVDSEDFNLLEKSLQEELLKTKENYGKIKKAAELTAYANTLIVYLHS